MYMIELIFTQGRLKTEKGYQKTQAGLICPLHKIPLGLLTN